MVPSWLRRAAACLQLVRGVCWITTQEIPAKGSLVEIMKMMKGFSASQANKILLDEIPKRQKGDSFWQEESLLPPM